MFTDMVGYTSLTQKDEAMALQLLETQRRLIRPRLESHGGKEVKTIGDAFLVEFGSALEAVRCAYEIQESIRDSKRDRRSDAEFAVRIGIHVGDVVHREGDIYGDAVNVASRIEPLSRPGGICLTRQVYDQVRNKLELPLLSLGPRELKNVAEPVEVFRVVLPWERDVEETPSPDVRRLAVLPFLNISPDAGDAYFADGMTEELISTLSKIRELSVISRTSAMRYRDRAEPVSTIGKELHVRTILEGSVRKAGNRLRVSVQMIDATEDRHIWAEDYDRELQDVFVVQSDIAQRVAQVLKVQLLSGEKTDIARRPTENPEAYGLYLKGRYFWNERTRAGADKAIKYFEEATKKDPSFALAYAGLADCYVIAPNYGWQTPSEANPNALLFASKAIELDPRLAEPHAALGLMRAKAEFKWNEGEEELKKAMDLKPSYATAYHWNSLIERWKRDFERSYELIRRAQELDPASVMIGTNVGEVLMVMGRVKEAVEQLEHVDESTPDHPFVHMELAWALFLDSQVDRAIEKMRRAVDLSGGDPYFKAELASFLGFAGMKDEANRIIGELEALPKSTYLSEGAMAMALFGVGRTDEGFEWLDRAFEKRSDVMLDFAFRPWFSEARKDQRWVSLKQRLGLD